jgi:serine/threonine-protein kinase
MKFRRHRPPVLRIDWRGIGTPFAKVLHRIRGWLASIKATSKPTETPTDSVTDHADVEFPSAAFKDWLVSRPGWLVGASAATATFVLGYLFAVVFLFPAPFFPRSQEIPRVVGLGLAEAVQSLEATRLVVSDTELVSHPDIEGGKVVWQDPPPEVAVPEGTGVALWVSRGPRPIPVPDVAGYDREVAARLIEAAGLRVARIDTTIAPQERGVVVNTRPPAGQSREPGDGITLFVSVGTPSISVPDLTGLRLDEARDILEELGLALGSTRTRRSTVADSGIIFGQDPAAGTLSAPGGAVNVTIVRGERP